MTHSLTRYVGRTVVVVLFALLLHGTLFAQLPDSTHRYYRLFLKDKGTPSRFLQRGDSSYNAAVAWLTHRALQRRAKVLDQARLVSTDDLPLYQPYLDLISATGAKLLQSSRWFNSVIVLADSIQRDQILTLPIFDSVATVRAVRKAVPPSPFGKTANVDSYTGSDEATAPTGCLTEHYGHSDYQNRMLGMDFAHRMGISGDGVLVGVLDAGFDYRTHRAFPFTKVVGEYDFVNHDSIAYDEPGEEGAAPEMHGTMVLSLMGATWYDTLVGGAPHAQFLLAKTEDVRSEHQIEEDNFVAGLEWLESKGVDVTNTSLGYTTFDPPDQPHSYDQLNGHTAFASRGVNHAVSLGVVCVLAAGNEGGAGRFNYVSVPAEADSAIAAAAVDSAGHLAGFSSRGFSGRSRIKPDVAALGVLNWAAQYTDLPGAISSQLVRESGTSFASPMTCAVVTLILSAAPELTPYQVRQLLYKTSSKASSPDTAFGYGIVNAGAALRELSKTRPVVGAPKAFVRSGELFVAAEVMNGLATPNTLTTSQLAAVAIGSAGSISGTSDAEPLNGLAIWDFGAARAGENYGDSVTISITRKSDGMELTRGYLPLDDQTVFNSSTLCDDVDQPQAVQVIATPNPFSDHTTINYFSKGGKTALRVYNSIGQLVYNDAAEDNANTTGYHVAHFTPAALAAGAYYYQLQVGDSMYSGSLIYLP